MDMARDFQDWDAGLHRRDPNSLKHYGILGMKWGMRRYQNSDGSLTAAGKRHYEKTGEYGYHYKSHATKKYTKKAIKNMKKADVNDVGAKLTKSHGKNEASQKYADKRDKYIAKAKKYLNRAKRSAELDKREQEAAKKVSTGRAIVNRLLVGGGTSKAYQQLNAMAGGKPGTAVKGTNAVRAWYGGSARSRISKAAYIRKGEKDHGIYNAINKGNEKYFNKAKQADYEVDRRKKKR